MKFKNISLALRFHSLGSTQGRLEIRFHSAVLTYWYFKFLVSQIWKYFKWPGVDYIFNFTALS